MTGYNISETNGIKISSGTKYIEQKLKYGDDLCHISNNSETITSQIPITHEDTPMREIEYFSFKSAINVRLCVYKSQPNPTPLPHTHTHIDNLNYSLAIAYRERAFCFKIRYELCIKLYLQGSTSLNIQCTITRSK
ncbi:hypothetical protein LSH36_1122g00016 [Paralvinella palmiformis]|uniref:Uncharacterized protein n=1 Tax=Paralvinella palmiformis TaxID=53620 RepID=A0AAD9MRM5_9ANNE|nr:hypothetical protein LSH36_1122g00016 [Paralvinella palmiformis]